MECFSTTKAQARRTQQQRASYGGGHESGHCHTECECLPGSGVTVVSADTQLVDHDRALGAPCVAVPPVAARISPAACVSRMKSLSPTVTQLWYIWCPEPKRAT